MLGSRLKYLDIAKGILIILVVLGHSDFQNKPYVYWFHMPAFFFISGMLHKQPTNKEVKSFLIRKTRNLLWSYLAFGLLVVCVISVFDSITHSLNYIHTLLILVVRLLFGGTLLFSAMSPFWFVPTLLLTIVSFTVLKAIVKKELVVQVITIGSFFVGAFIGGKIHFHVPWHADVVPVSLFYYGIGFYSNNIVRSVYTSPYKTVITFITIAICLSLLFAGVRNVFFFRLDMKYSVYSNYILSIIIPLIFSLGVIVLSMVIEKTVLCNALAYTGFNSLVIMYLHFPVNSALLTLAGHDYGVILFVLIGTVMPLIIDYLIRISPVLSKLFYGSKDKKDRSLQLQPTP